MKSILISAALSIIASFCSFAQSSKAVSAQVVDGNTGEPVEFACVSNLSHTIGFMANGEGRFKLTESDFSKISETNNNSNASQKKSGTGLEIEQGKDSLVISRIGYESLTLEYDHIPEIIYLKPSPNTLHSVTVVPKKKKTLGDLCIPNPIQKKAFDLVSKYDFLHQVNHHIESEIGRPFKFKNDSRINKIRLSVHENDSVIVVVNVYRKVDDDWIAIHDKPIVIEVPASDDWRNVVEVNVSEELEPQPKGEYLVGVTKQGDGQFNMWSRKPLTVDGRQRIVGTDKWKRIDPVPGIEIDIEY